MKVVHVSTTDYGGAYRAAARISESMSACGIDSQILIRTKRYSDTPGTEIFSAPYQKFWSKVKNGVNLLLSRGEVVSDYLGTDITKHPLVREADVIILHWVNSFVSYGTVELLKKTDRPIIWVMHDMWLFTGGCHVDQNCGGYQHRCGNCPFLKSGKENDISRRNFRRKRAMLAGSDVVLAGPSKWITDCASQSMITQKQRIVRIPNPIDTELYRPVSDKTVLREKYGVPQNKKVILYGAMKATADQNKGYHVLIEALRCIDRKEYMLVIFGNDQKDENIEALIDTLFMGYVRDEKILIELYNLADVFVAPSRQENYPNSVVEASSCGTPVTAFRVGGIPEIVVHRESGYLAPYGEVKEIAAGIVLCAERTEQMGEMARKRITETNSYLETGKRYAELIRELMGQKQYG